MNDIDGFFYAKNHRLLCLKTKLSKDKLCLNEGVTYVACAVEQVKGALVLIPMSTYSSDSSSVEKSINRLLELDRFVVGSIKSADENLLKILGFK